MSVISGTVGAIMGADATKSAANTQAAAARYAADLQKEMFDKGFEESKRQYELARQDLAPYREAGAEALGTLRSLNQPGGYFQRDFGLADFEQDPGYQFRLAEGQKALERSAAARGGVLSGRTLKDLTRFGQDTASAEFLNAYNRFTLNRQNRFNRLAALAGIGQTGTTTTAQLGAGYASNAAQLGQAYGQSAGELALQGANARASGYIGQANAMGGALNSLSQLPSTIRAYQNLFGGRTGGNVVSPYPAATTPSPTFQGSGTTATLAYTGSAAQAADAAAAAEYMAYF